MLPILIPIFLGNFPENRLESTILCGFSKNPPNTHCFRPLKKWVIALRETRVFCELREGIPLSVDNVCDVNVRNHQIVPKFPSSPLISGTNFKRKLTTHFWGAHVFLFWGGHLSGSFFSRKKTATFLKNHHFEYYCRYTTKKETRLANGPWNKNLNFIFPTKYISKSLKSSLWPSKETNMETPNWWRLETDVPFIRPSFFSGFCLPIWSPPNGKILEILKERIVTSHSICRVLPDPEKKNRLFDAYR